MTNCKVYKKCNVWTFNKSLGFEFCSKTPRFNSLNLRELDPECSNIGMPIFRKFSFLKDTGSQRKAINIILFLSHPFE
jgi:hypothetical protein